jgi:hypothetical protein
MQVGNEIKGFAFVLQFYGWLHHSQIIAEVEGAGGLDARKNTFHVRRNLAVIR